MGLRKSSPLDGKTLDLEINKSDLPQARPIIRVAGQQEGLVPRQVAHALAAVGVTGGSIYASWVKDCLDRIVGNDLDSAQTKPALDGQLVVIGKDESYSKTSGVSSITKLQRQPV